MIVNLAGLGLCEHCGALITMEGLSAEAIDAEWNCPKCGEVLAHESFGYESGKGDKIKWVGPDGKWTTEKPTNDFRLGSWDILIHGLGHWFPPL